MNAHKLHVIYHDGTYDEGTHDEVASRRGDRMSASEVELPDFGVLPEEFQEAKTLQNKPLSERIAELGEAGNRAKLGEIAQGARGAPSELETLLAIKEQLELRIAELQQ